MRYVIFLTIFGSILAGGHAYVGSHLARPFAAGSRQRRAVFALAAVLALLPFVAFSSRVSGAEGPLVDAMAWVGYSSMGLSSMLFCVARASMARLTTAGRASESQST